MNHCALGNVLRKAGRLAEALAAFEASGGMARSIGRIDLEGRSRRLSAMMENEWAETEAERGRSNQTARAEVHATRAIDMLADSFTEAERSRAYEERGAARLLLGREADALADYADAAAGYLDDGEWEDAVRLLPFVVERCEGRTDAVVLIARSLGDKPDRPATGSDAWVRAGSAALRRCPEDAAPGLLGVLIHRFMPGTSGDWWFQCLIRCLLALDRHGGTNGLRLLGPTLLMSVLAFGPHRRFALRDLLTLAGLCLDRSRRAIARHRPEDLDLIVRVGPLGQALFTVRTTMERP